MVGDVPVAMHCPHYYRVCCNLFSQKTCPMANLHTITSCSVPYCNFRPCLYGIPSHFCDIHMFCQFPSILVPYRLHAILCYFSENPARIGMFRRDRIIASKPAKFSQKTKGTLVFQKISNQS